MDKLGTNGEIANKTHHSTYDVATCEEAVRAAEEDLRKARSAFKAGYGLHYLIAHAEQRVSTSQTQLGIARLLAKRRKEASGG